MTLPCGPNPLVNLPHLRGADVEAVPGSDRPLGTVVGMADPAMVRRCRLTVPNPRSKHLKLSA
jgi:hypothetical protein